MRKLVFLFLLISIVASCSSTADLYVNSLSQDDLKKIEDIEGAFLDYWQDNNPARLDRIEKGLAEMLAGPFLAAPVKGKLLAMNAELLFYRGKAADAAKQLELSEKADSAGERLFITRSIMEKDVALKKRILSTGYEKAQTHSLIALFLAELHSSQGEYKPALAMYDEAFRGLDVSYRAYYQKKRDIAFQFVDKPVPANNMAALAGVSVLNIEQAITVIGTDTSYFDAVSFRKDLTASDLFTRLVEYGYLYSSLTLSSPLTRRDLSFLLLHVIVSLEEDPILLTRTSTKYRQTGKPSPISDVAVSDYFFDSVVVCVEREVLDLPDGAGFYPDRAVSGLELMSIMERLRLRYGK